jgi:hypothetical protein
MFSPMNRGWYTHLLQINLDVVEVIIRGNNGLDLKGKKKKGSEKNGEEKYKHIGVAQASKK